MEDMFAIAAIAAKDLAFGHAVDVECECTMCTQALIEARRGEPRCRIEDYDVECECPACDAITGARESFLRLGDEY